LLFILTQHNSYVSEVKISLIYESKDENNRKENFNGRRIKPTAAKHKILQFEIINVESFRVFIAIKNNIYFSQLLPPGAVSKVNIQAKNRHKFSDFFRL